MGVFVKLSSSSLEVLEIIFFRTLIGFLILYLILKKKKLTYNAEIFYLHFIRAGVSLFAMFLMFYSISKLPLSNVSIVSFSKIFFILPLAIVFLKEKINLRSLVLIFLGYIGVIIVIGFNNDGNNFIFYTYALLGTLMLSIAKIIIKRISKCDNAIVIQFWFNFISLIILIIPYAFISKLPSFLDFTYAFIATISGLLAQFYTIIGLKEADVSVVMPFDFSKVIFGIVLGVLVFNEEIGLSVVVGSIFVIISGCLLAIRNIDLKL